MMKKILKSQIWKGKQYKRWRLQFSSSGSGKKSFLLHWEVF